MLKVEYSIDYLKDEGISSENSKLLEEIQHVKQVALQQKPPIERFKRSDDGPKLPKDFKLGEAVGSGDCFFDSVAQGLKQLKPEMDFTVKSLREICKKFAQSQLENDQSWLKGALTNENEGINVYIPRIGYTASDIEQKSESVNALRLNSPIWGRSEIEGVMICKEYNVKLHIVEKHIVEGKEMWLDQIVNSEGSKSVDVDSVDYKEVDTIHIINRGANHFEPILNKARVIGNVQQESEQSLSDNRQSNPDNQPIDSAQHHQINQSPDSTDYDDEVTPEEELINTIKSSDSEEKKVEKIKELFKNEPKLNFDFQDTKNGDTPLHIAIRKEKLQVIKLLIRNKARIDIKNNKRKTSLDIAQSLKKQDIVQLLKTGYIDSNVQALIKDRRKSIDNRGLLIAAAQRNQKEVERLIKEGVNVDFVDAKGNIALHYAVSGGDLSIVQLTSKQSKNANTANNDSETPLDIAERLGKKDIVQALKAQQLSVGAQSSTQQQSQQKRARVDSEENKLEDSNSKKLRTSSSDHQSMEVNRDISRKRIHFQDDRESSVVLEAESNVATSSNHQNVEFGNISSKKRVRFQSNQEDIGALNIRQSTSFLDKPNKYAASGVKNSLHGCIYQLKLLMLFLKRGLDKGYSFRLATEMDAAEKFDDLVFEYKREGGGSAYRFLQAKHKQDEKSIEVRDLLTEDQDGEFRLAKYFVSYRKIKKKPEFNGKNDEIQDFIICTNAGLSNDLQDRFEQIAAQDDLLDVSSESKYPKRLKLKIEKFPIAALKDASDINRLAKRLIECAIGNKDIDLKDGLFKEYHTALASEVINVKDKKFKTGFIDNDNLSEKAQKFREVLLAKGNLSQKEFEIKMKDINLKLSSTFGKGFKPDDSPRVTNPREFSEAIVNAIKNANNNIVSIKREPSKAGIIKDNINKLAGYVLIEKDDGETNTYYFSPTFFDDSHKLPGNLEDFKSKLKAELKNKNIDFDKEKYKFHIANFQTCKEGQLHTKFELPDDHVTEAEIESFFEKLVFAVNQPNEIELGKILEAKISREFSEKFNYIGSISRDAYNKFQIEVLNWMKEKEGRFLSNEKVKEFFMETEQQISTLSIIEKEVKKANGKIDGVEKIVESNNKILKEVHSIVAEKSNQQTQGSIWFDMIYPVRSFTGRTSELETLHDALEDRQVAIPQMVSIAGLGGVGKSELARKYAYSYSKDYDNNVIWVNAGTQET